MKTSDDELRERLNAAKARRAELASKREAREAAEALEREVQAEELAARNETAIEAAIAAHGRVGRDLAIVETTAGVVILKRAPAPTFKRFMDAGETKVANLDALVRKNVVHPDAQAFDRLIEEQPAVLARCADAIATLAGARAEEVREK